MVSHTRDTCGCGCKYSQLHCRSCLCSAATCNPIIGGWKTHCRFNYKMERLNWEQMDAPIPLHQQVEIQMIFHLINICRRRLRFSIRHPQLINGFWYFRDQALVSNHQLGHVGTCRILTSSINRLPSSKTGLWSLTRSELKMCGFRSRHLYYL